MGSEFTFNLAPVPRINQDGGNSHEFDATKVESSSIAFSLNQASWVICAGGWMSSGPRVMASK